MRAYVTWVDVQKRCGLRHSLSYDDRMLFEEEENAIWSKLALENNYYLEIESECINDIVKK